MNINHATVALGLHSICLDLCYQASSKLTKHEGKVWFTLPPLFYSQIC